MIFRNKRFKNIALLIIALLIMSCKSKSASEYSKPFDTISFDGLFFARETILIRSNGSVVFQKQVDSTRDFQSVYASIVINKLDTVNLSVQTFYNKRKIIDTTFVIPPLIYVHSIGGSICYPSYISQDSLRKIEKPRFGYIPIDSCKRYVSLMTDSIMHRYPNY